MSASTLLDGSPTAAAAEDQPMDVKVAYLCSEYPAVSHTFVLREVEALRRRGAEVTTFTIRRTDPAQLLAEADHAASATTFAILPPRWRQLLWAHARLVGRAPRAYLSTLAHALAGARPGLRGRLWQCFYFAEAGLLCDECERRGIRHVHVHFANAAADIAMLATRLGSGLERGSGLGRGSEPGRGSGLGRAREWSWSFTMHGPTELFDLHHYRLAEKLADARFVVCISDFARSQLMALSEPETWRKLHVIHVGLPIERFTRATSPAASRSLAGGGAPPSPFVDGGASPSPDGTILCVGRLVPEKGQAVLLQALALLAERGHVARAVFVGAGRSLSGLERLAERLGVSSRISFLGAVGQDEIRALYERASIFCLPSFAEGVPVVLMEAMAMELPVLSTRITGIPELIEDGRTGLLVAPGRPDALADALERLLLNAGLRRELGASAREWVCAEFNAERSAAQLHALFVERLGARAVGARLTT